MLGKRELGTSGLSAPESLYRGLCGRLAYPISTFYWRWKQGIAKDQNRARQVQWITDGFASNE